MIPWLLRLLDSTHVVSWGPLRLANSHFFLAVCGFIDSVVATWLLLPRFWGELNVDQGRAHAVEAHKSVGKPLSGGLVFITIFIVMALLFVPFRTKLLGVLPLVLAAMVLGFFDDKIGGFHEYTLAIADFAISLGTVLVLFGIGHSIIWLPFISRAFLIPGWANVAIFTGVIWLAINAMNCSDGVDGLSGSLAAISLTLIATLLYVVIGNAVVARYLLIPHDPEGASWSILAFMLIGCLVGYLWYNAPPSQVLMGDAGSRPLGLLVGIMVAVTRNPLLIVIVGSVILMNGATGLVKVAVMRFLKLGVLRGIRFPLHDHCRANLGWSSSQVLVRFVLAHIFLSAVLLALLLKVR